MIKTTTAILCIIVFLFYALGNSFAAMMMYWWFGLFRPQDWMWGDISQFRVPLIAALLFFGYSLVQGNWPCLTGNVHKAIALFAIITVLAQIGSGCESFYALTYDYIVVLVVAVLITSKYLTNLKRVWGITFLISVSYAIPNIEYSFISFFSGGSLYNAMIGSGSISGSNAVSLAAGMCFFLLLPTFVLATKHQYYVRSIFSPFTIKVLVFSTSFILVGLLLVVYMTDSRGSAIALFTGFTVWVVLQRKAVSLVLLCATIVTLMWSTGLIPKAYTDRISSAFVEQEELDASAASRPHFWSVAYEMSKGKLFGVGPGCYQSSYNTYDPSNGSYGRYRSVHSSYFNILAEQGIFGFCTWIFINISTLFTLLQLRSRSKADMESNALFISGAVFTFSTAIFASKIVFLIGAIFYEFSYNDITWLSFVIVIALKNIYNSEHEAAMHSGQSD